MTGVNRTLNLLLAIVLLVFLPSCSSTPSTKLTRVWKDDTYQGGFLQSVMVVGVAKKFERRKRFEDVFVKQFEKKGVRAVSSAAVISPDQELNKNSLKAAAQKLNIDAILVTHFVGVKTKEVYRPSSIPAPPPNEYSFDDFYYSDVYDNTQFFGRYSEKKKVKLKSKLYETTTGKKIWSATTKTTNPKTVGDIIDSVSKTVMNGLREHKLLK